MGTEKTAARQGDEEASADARPTVESRQRSWCDFDHGKESGKECGEQQVRPPRHNRYGHGKLLSMLALAAFTLLVFALQGAVVYWVVWQVRGGFGSVVRAFSFVLLYRALFIFLFLSFLFSLRLCFP